MLIKATLTTIDGASEALTYRFSSRVVVGIYSKHQSTTADIAQARSLATRRIHMGKRQAAERPGGLSRSSAISVPGIASVAVATSGLQNKMIKI